MMFVCFTLSLTLFVCLFDTDIDTENYTDIVCLFDTDIACLFDTDTDIVCILYTDTDDVCLF